MQQVAEFGSGTKEDGRRGEDDMLNPIFRTKLWNQYLASGFNLSFEHSRYFQAGTFSVMRSGPDTFRIISHPETKVTALDAVGAVTKFIQAEEKSYQSSLIELLPILF